MSIVFVFVFNARDVVCSQKNVVLILCWMNIWYDCDDSNGGSVKIPDWSKHQTN